MKFLAEECDQGWAKRLHDLLLEGKQRVELAKAAGRMKLSRGLLQKIRRRYEVLVGQGLRANPPPQRVSGGPSRGRIKKSKATNLAERLQRYRVETLRFLSDFSVPYDNNLAERDLRMMKVQQKNSGTYRSATGAMGFCRIRSLISTVKKQGASVVAALSLIFDGKNDLSLSSCLQKG